jgi:AcrR family transcriptional regulator
MRTIDHEKHQARRTHIIESAVVLFASKGFADTTTADICQAAGISTGSLFHYFPSKQAVFYGIWELDRSEWEEVSAAAEADPDPWAALMAIVDKLAADAAEPIMAGLLVEVIAQGWPRTIAVRSVTSRGSSGDCGRPGSLIQGCPRRRPRVGC